MFVLPLDSCKKVLNKKAQEEQIETERRVKEKISICKLETGPLRGSRKKVVTERIRQMAVEQSRT